MSRSNSSTSNSEIAEAVVLFKRLAVFGLPFMLAAAFIFAVDPFDYFRVVGAIPSETKYSVAKQIDPCFWRLNQFERTPTENILLGDSRMEALSTESIKQVSGDDYTNLAYAGGTLREAIDSFWIASKRTKLKRAYIGVGLTTYNDYDNSNRIQFYSSVRQNPALYFVNRGVWESSYYILSNMLSGKEAKLGVPTMQKDEFWQEELDVLQKYYDRYAEPRIYRRGLEEISNYCRANGIELNFVIFPMHSDAQRQLAVSKMQEPGAAMRRDLLRFGRLLDFEFDSEIDRNKDNFNDPVHTNGKVREILINEIWGPNHNSLLNRIDNP